MPVQPTMLWAQRTNLIYLTIEVADFRIQKLEITKDKFYFKGVGGLDRREHEAEIEFYGAVDPENLSQHLTGRKSTMVVAKKKDGWWPKVQKGDKLNFVKTDFDKWVDEEYDEEESLAVDPMGLDFQDSMAAGDELGDLDDLPEGDSNDEEEQK